MKMACHSNVSSHSLLVTYICLFIYALPLASHTTIDGVHYFNNKYMLCKT